MIQALVKQQFPAVEVRGVSETQNTGNFVVTDGANQAVLWPYGFVCTTAKQRVLLGRILEQFGGESDLP